MKNGKLCSQTVSFTHNLHMQLQQLHMQISYTYLIIWLSHIYQILTWELQQCSDVRKNNNLPYLCRGYLDCMSRCAKNWTLYSHSYWVCGTNTTNIHCCRVLLKWTIALRCNLVWYSIRQGCSRTEWLSEPVYSFPVRVNFMWFHPHSMWLY